MKNFCTVIYLAIFLNLPGYSQSLPKLPPPKILEQVPSLYPIPWQPKPLPWPVPDENGYNLGQYHSKLDDLDKTLSDRHFSEIDLFAKGYQERINSAISHLPEIDEIQINFEDNREPINLGSLLHEVKGLEVQDLHVNRYYILKRSDLVNRDNSLSDNYELKYDDTVFAIYLHIVNKAGIPIAGLKTNNYKKISDKGEIVPTYIFDDNDLKIKLHSFSVKDLVSNIDGKTYKNDTIENPNNELIYEARGPFKEQWPIPVQVDCFGRSLIPISKAVENEKQLLSIFKEYEIGIEGTNAKEVFDYYKKIKGLEGKQTLD